MTNQHNKDSIRQLLLSNNLAVERAILAIFARQTSQEQASGETLHHNGVGFSGAHCKLGTYYAGWLRSGRHLSGHHLDKARNMALHYTGQLLEIAQQKAT